jgi:hypothetical protein
MITKNKPLIVLFAIGMIAYLITDLFFNDAILYLVGGALGTLLKPVGLQKGFYIVWLIILIGIVVLYQKINSNVLKWALLILIWVLLYLVDVALYEILPDITSSAATYLHIGLSVLIKSSLLTWIYYRGKK